MPRPHRDRTVSFEAMFASLEASRILSQQIPWKTRPFRRIRLHVLRARQACGGGILSCEGLPISNGPCS